MPAISAALSVQSSRKKATSDATTKGPAKGDADSDRCLEPPAHVGRIDFHPGQEGEHDRGERGDEVEPLLAAEIEDVSDGDAQGELEQRDGDAELDREHARNEHDCCKNGGELNGLHADLHFASNRRSVEAISPEGRLGASLIAQRRRILPFRCLAIPAQPEHEGERAGRAWPVLLDELPTAAAEDRTQDEGNENRVVELPRDGDEVGHEVERQRQVGDEPDQDQLVPPRHAAVAREPREENHAVRDEAGEGPRVLPASREEQDEDEAEVEKEADPGRERRPLPTCHEGRRRGSSGRGLESIWRSSWLT